VTAPQNDYSPKSPARPTNSQPKTSKAEQEYQSAFEEQARENKNHETAKANLQEAQRSLPNLRDQAAIHNATQTELDDLYASIFSLPHAEYPQETAANAEIALLQVPIAALKKQIETESQALKLLTNAKKYLVWCNAAIMNASDADGNNFLPVSEGHALGINIIRNAMSLAQAHAAQAEAAYSAAQAAQASIQPMKELQILDEKCLLIASPKPGGVARLLDSYELRDRIKRVRGAMGEVVEEVAREVGVAGGRVKRLGRRGRSWRGRRGRF
jgi:hypothetical protein